MALQVYNTLTRQKAPFEPVTPGKIGIYLCGPTVYKPSHIGHAVGPIIFDAIKRYLVYSGYDVTWVVNITDVDDKLIDEAAAQNTTTMELAERVTKDYLDAMAKLPEWKRPKPRYVVHRVRRGETLGHIARRYRTSVRAIQRANGIRNPNRLRVGQRLKIPTRRS